MDANLGSLLLQLNSLGILAHDGKPPDFKNFVAEDKSMWHSALLRRIKWFRFVSICFDRKISEQKKMLGNSTTHSPVRFDIPCGLEWETFKSHSVIISANVTVFWIQHDVVDTCVKGSPFVNIVNSACFLCGWTWTDKCFYAPLSRITPKEPLKRLNEYSFIT